MAARKRIVKEAGAALEQAIGLMKVRLESAAEAEGKKDPDAAKIIKNDELIKMAVFAAGIVKDDDENERKKLQQKSEKNAAEEENEIRVVMESEVEKLAK